MNLQEHEYNSLNNFLHNYLRRDGLLILRLISKNAGEIIAAEILHGLWMNYLPEGKCTEIILRDGTVEEKKQRPVANHDIV